MENLKDFVARRPDWVGFLDVAGWEQEAIMKDGSKEIVIDLKLGNRVRLRKNKQAVL